MSISGESKGYQEFLLIVKNNIHKIKFAGRPEM